MRTSRKRIVFLITVGVLAIGVVIAAALFAGHYVQASKYQKQIEVANRYLQQTDYTNARVAFSVALNMDDTQEDAYVGLVYVYEAVGDHEMALQILHEGLLKTDGQQLTVLQNTIEWRQGSSEEKKTEGADENIVAALNTSLLDMLSSYSYDNYRARYGIESCAVQDDSCDVRVNTVAATMYYYPTEANPRVLNGSGEKPVAELRPTSITLDNISLLFSGAQTVSYAQIQGFSVTGLQLTEDSEHGNVLTFTAKNCLVYIACDENGNIKAGAWNRIVPVEVEPQNDKGAVLSGNVIDAVTASGVHNAEMTFVSRTDNSFKEITQTDSYGKYEIQLPSGAYKVTIRCDGYTEETFECTVSSYSARTECDFTISPELEEGQIRIVLTWGSSPTDLDSHLNGVTDHGQRVNTSYMNQTCLEGGEVVAELDVDDRDGFGPETTTIYEVNGVYDFHVVDFTSSGTMSASGAVVKVYTPNSNSPVEIPICAGLENEWYVCRIDHGEVIVKNTPAASGTIY